jgi:hypothetical protein
MARKLQQFQPVYKVYNGYKVDIIKSETNRKKGAPKMVPVKTT